MSFGWSAGEIIAALKLLQQIGVALKDSGGACSEPLANIAVGQWRGRYRPILSALVLGLRH
jgi:hypothetical protein